MPGSVLRGVGGGTRDLRGWEGGTALGFQLASCCVGVFVGAGDGGGRVRGWVAGAALLRQHAAISLTSV
jgi:hypothetical protein